MNKKGEKEWGRSGPAGPTFQVTDGPLTGGQSPLCCLRPVLRLKGSQQG